MEVEMKRTLELPKYLLVLYFVSHLRKKNENLVNASVCDHFVLPLAMRAALFCLPMTARS